MSHMAGIQADLPSEEPTPRCGHVDDHLTVSEREVMCQDCGRIWVALRWAHVDQTMDEMVERGAQALLKAITATEHWPGDDWDHIALGYQDKMRADARSVLVAALHDGDAG